MGLYQYICEDACYTIRMVKIYEEHSSVYIASHDMIGACTGYVGINMMQ